MNIAVISKGALLYSTQSILKAGLARNHAMEVLNPSLCKIEIVNNSPTLYYMEEPVKDIDAVIPRIGASNTYYGSSVIRHFERMGVFCTVSALSISQSRDKWVCAQELTKAAIPIPITTLGIGASPEQLLNTHTGPVIIKLIEGTHGQGVFLAHTKTQAIACIEMLQATNTPFIIQEYIEESQGSDVRAIIVDGVVVAAMKRNSKPGEFRSNLHRGGNSEKITLSTQEEQLALKTAKTLRLGICGVDILQSNRGPLVLEVNSTPGLEGIEKTTGTNISKRIISYIERNNSR